MAKNKKKKKQKRTPDQLRDAKLAFKLDLEEVPVTIGGDDYTLREMNGKDRDKYLNGLSSRIKTTGHGENASQTVRNFDGLQSSLLAKCLFDVEGKLVPAATIQAWPARVVSDLFDAARDLSGLNDEAEGEGDDEEGND